MNLGIGVIRREAAPAERSPRTVAATAAFAAAVAQRHTAEAVTVSRAELALGWRPTGEVNYFHDARRIEISPTVTIQELHSFAAVAKEVVRPREAADGYGDAAAGALFRRLFSRQMRLAAFASPPGPQTARVGKSDPASARPLDTHLCSAVVERSLPRPAAKEGSPVPAEVPAPVQPAAHGTEWGLRPIFPNEPQPITLPAPEILRVAEQVMREIDHRIVARRERLGKR
jgi:hypothetical protein